MPRKSSVTLCQIVRNEAHQLEQCLAPVAGLFDEIVIVDTGSHDQTRQIARGFTPHVFDFPWCDDFAAARNETLRHAHGEWIFWLDADDRLDAENVERLRTLLDGLADSRQVYLLDTVCRMTSATDTVRVITHPRLFRRHPELKWRGRVHEQLRPAPAELGYESYFCDVRITHLGYQDAAARQRKLQRDIRLLRLDYAVDPDDVSTLLHLGLAYSRQANFSAARQCLLPLVDGGLGNSDHLRQVYGSLAEMAMAEGDFQEVLQITQRGLRSFPDEDVLWYLQAEGLYELGQYDASRRAVLAILALPDLPRYRGGGLGDVKSRLAPRTFANLQRISGDFAGAEQTLRRILHQFPEDALTWYMLGCVYLDSRRGSELDQVAAALGGCLHGPQYVSLLWASCHLQTGELDAAEAHIDRLIGELPHLPLPRLFRCELLRRRGASPATRVQATRDLLRVQPQNSAAQAELAQLELASRAAAVAPLDCCTSVLLGAGVPGGVVLS